MYRLVVSDMDDTFLDPNHSVPPANINALRRLRELGIIFAPSSGRSFPSIMLTLQALGDDLLEGLYVISINGAFINHVGEPEPVVSTVMDQNIAAELWRRGRDLGYPMHIYTTDGTFYLANANEEERRWLDGFGVVDVGPAPESFLSFTNGLPVVKINYSSHEFDYMHQLGPEYVEELGPEKIQLTYSMDRYLEFMPAGVSKGTGLIQLAGLLGIDLAETVAMGDSENDASMVQAAGLGVGVANALPALRPYCDVVLETEARDGALPEVVERYLEPATR